MSRHFCWRGIVGLQLRGQVQHVHSSKGRPKTGKGRAFCVPAVTRGLLRGVTTQIPLGCFEHPMCSLPRHQQVRRCQQSIQTLRLFESWRSSERSCVRLPRYGCRNWPLTYALATLSAAANSIPPSWRASAPGRLGGPRNVIRVRPAEPAGVEASGNIYPVA